MHAEPFDYHRAESVAHALELLEANEDATVLAGGHAVIPLMKQREITPEAVVDIGGLDALAGIERTGSAIRIGALTTHSEVRESPVLRESAPVYPRTVARITGGRQVHNFATIGGNVARAHPGYDYEGTLLATDSEVVVRGPGGRETVPAADFFRGALSTALEDTQLITTIVVPRAAGHRRGGYAKRKEPGSGNAIVGVATDLLFETQRGEQIETARVGVNGLQGSAVRLTAVEEALAGATVTDETVRTAAAAAGDSISAAAVLDNKKASSKYRLSVLPRQVRESIEEAAGMAGGEAGSNGPI
jgi:carbon-monoxide dehydrogenase medium subunit